MDENHSCLFQQGFPSAWSKFSYFHPCQNNLQAPPMAEHLNLVKQVSFIHVQHLKSSEKNISAQHKCSWSETEVVEMHWKFRCKVALMTYSWHREAWNIVNSTSPRDAIGSSTALLLSSEWKWRIQPAWSQYGSWTAAFTTGTGAWKLQQKPASSSPK